MASPLGKAKALNRLGEVLSLGSGTREARDSHAEALTIAWRIGVPLEEARALEGIGKADLREGSHNAGLECLEQALTVYQSLGAPDAERVQKILDQHATSPTQGNEPARSPG